MGPVWYLRVAALVPRIHSQVKSVARLARNFLCRSLKRRDIVGFYFKECVTKIVVCATLGRNAYGGDA